MSNIQAAKNPIVTIELENLKVIKIELYPELAPNTVNNFISLVKKGFYNGLRFHIAIAGFVIKGGCPKGTGAEGPGYSIKGEFINNGVNNPIKHVKGVISMIRSHPDSAGSQFFIVIDNASGFDWKYAAFGKTIEGFDALNEIADTEVDLNDRPIVPQIMRSVTVETFGVEYPEPIIIE